MAGVFYLLLRSPVTIPVLFLAYLMGWRRWLSKEGIFAYWFILLPTALYISAYCLVFLDSRYIAGSLVVVWMCLLASITMPSESFRRRANSTVRFISVVFALVFLVSKLSRPAKIALVDMGQRQETAWNLNWVLAERLKELGFKAGDRIAMIGQSIDCEWARLDNLRIIAEVPVLWEREEGTLFRRVYADRKDLKRFSGLLPRNRPRFSISFGELVQRQCL